MTWRIPPFSSNSIHFSSILIRLSPLRLSARLRQRVAHLELQVGLVLETLPAAALYVFLRRPIYVFLPRDLAADLRRCSDSQRASIRSEYSQHQATDCMHYLIVDDHPMTLQAVIDSLAEPGDSFAEAGTGEEAIAYCEQHSADWIIMDVKMPGRGGIFATREITAKHPGTRVVVMSQYDDELMADEARTAGAIDFISKDRIAELPEILNELGRDPVATINNI